MSTVPDALAPIGIVLESGCFFKIIKNLLLFEKVMAALEPLTAACG
ncbi:MAG: hypothetical protein P8176_02210 [Gammaproteobacteria bacterium]